MPNATLILMKNLINFQFKKNTKYGTSEARRMYINKTSLHFLNLKLKKEIEITINVLTLDQQASFHTTWKLQPIIYIPCFGPQLRMMMVGSMVVKIAIWIIGSHDFTIPPHQNIQNCTRIVKMVGSCRVVWDSTRTSVLMKL